MDLHSCVLWTPAVFAWGAFLVFAIVLVDTSHYLDCGAFKTKEIFICLFGRGDVAGVFFHVCPQEFIKIRSVPGVGAVKFRTFGRGRGQYGGFRRRSCNSVLSCDGPMVGDPFPLYSRGDVGPQNVDVS